jgi:hypothetical protein
MRAGACEYATVTCLDDDRPASAVRPGKDVADADGSPRTGRAPTSHVTTFGNVQESRRSGF